MVMLSPLHPDQGKAAAADREEKRNDRQMGRQMGVAETE